MKIFLVISLLISSLFSIEVMDEGRTIYFEENVKKKPYFIKIYNFKKSSKYVRLSSKLISAPNNSVESLNLSDLIAVIPASSYINYRIELAPEVSGKYLYEVIIREKGSAQSFILPVSFIKN